MIVTWTRMMAVEVKRVVDSRAIFQVLSTSLGDTLDEEEKERGTMTSVFLSGTAGMVMLFTMNQSTGREHFDEDHKFSLGHIEVWG